MKVICDCGASIKILTKKSRSRYSTAKKFLNSYAEDASMLRSFIDLHSECNISIENSTLQSWRTGDVDQEAYNSVVSNMVYEVYMADGPGAAGKLGAAMHEYIRRNYKITDTSAEKMPNKSAEQKARDLLERMGVEGAQDYPDGELVELANLMR